MKPVNSLTTFNADTIGAARTILHRGLDDATEADRLLCHALGCERARLYAHPETVLSPGHRQHLDVLLQKRRSGTPLAYLTGVCEFFSLEFEVTPEVLIPRAATETLVETALALMPEDAPGGTRVLDLGTGCGAIAVALAHARPNAKIIACDNSRNALELAKRNAKRHATSNVSFVESDWYEQLPDVAFHVIAANPPYIADGDPDLDPDVIAYEPHTAVLAENNGLACLQRIIAAAPTRLHNRGTLAVEHGHTQAEAVARLVGAAGFGDIYCTCDLAGHPRVTVGFKQSPQERS